jgi:nucleotide-binding universal stress UspA family protein
MKLLLATDGSEYSMNAGAFITRLAWSENDEISVVHVVGWVPFQYDEEFYLSTLREIKEEIAPRILDTTLDVLKPVQAKTSVAIIEGSPEPGIMQAAADCHADMIVMGARGVKGLESLFVGSVTRSVAVTSPKPVLVVRPSALGPGSMKILFAADGSEYSCAAGELLSQIPFPDDTEITIMHVIWPKFSDIPERFSAAMNDRVKEFAARAREKEVKESESIIAKATGQLTRRFKQVHALTRVGDPSTELLRAADMMHADLIVVGCRGLQGMKGMLGSVSRNVLAHASCSVLIGKRYAGEGV